MILATNNEGKLREIKDILNDYEIVSLKEAKVNIEVVEDQETFYGNALKKAQEIYDITEIPTIADDSGLIIDALGDFPGVMTHRFLGDEASDRERNLYLINESRKLKDKSARVICVLVYYDGVNTIVGNGEIKGVIADKPRGKNGFGFDEIFLLPNGKTLAELTISEKNKCSARYMAALDLKEKLAKLNKTCNF